MHLLYNFYYKQFGTRRIQQLLAPRFFEFSSFPKNSFLHYLTNDEHYDLDISKPYFNQFTKRILVDYPSELKSDLGAPKKKAILLKNLFRPFHIQNKQFKYQIDNYKTTNDPTTLMVNNYNYLKEAYRYIDMPMTTYNRWKNIQFTLWNNISEISKETDRHHFVFVDIPKDIPSYGLFNIYVKKTNIALLKVFDTYDKLFILEMWKWLSDGNRQDSVLSKIEPKDYPKINIVFSTPDNKNILINLGYLNSWIKGQENTTEFANITQYNNIQIQKLFLKFLLTIQSLVPEEVAQDVIDGETVIPENKPSEDELSSSDDELIDEENIDNKPNETPEGFNYSYVTKDEKNSDSNEINKSALSDKHVKIQSELDIDIDDALKDIEGDIEELDKINNAKLKNNGLHIDKNGEVTDIEIDNTLSEEELNKIVFEDKTPTSAVKDIIADNAEYGLLSASEYRKLNTDAENYSKMKDPYGSEQTVIEKSIVTENDLNIDHPDKDMIIPEFITDKSMGKSSLNTFDVTYINNVLQKDIVGMTGAIQKAGVIIKDHEIEEDHSVLGTYEIHTLKLKPVDGVESTIRLRIPKVNEDGTFVVSSNKYVMRKQRVDVPIRKIAPDIVALTSYYGKTFVSTGQKKANDSISWIINRLEKLLMEEDSYIKRLNPGNVYLNNIKTPSVYGALSKHFRSIHTKDATFFFDYKKRQESVITTRVDPTIAEKDGSVIVGITINNELIVINKDNHFIVHTKKGLVNVGNIFDVLKLDELKAPINFSELRVFTKTIPVGLVLSYFIGFKNLLKLLKVNYRIVEGRGQKHLEPHEYSITFKDQSLIFSKKDKKSTMIIAGMLEFDKYTKQYMLNEFDHKDVYFNLLDSKGFSSIYIRELELTDQLFVDPITKSILESMNEPITFKGLLIRASEMLLTYDHPDSQDMQYMRIRGYERFSGVIYKELVASIRQYRNRNIAGKSRIEMSPYQVWGTIMKDSANKLVEDINPIQNLKETEIVTYVGEGGRGKESMNKASRAYHVNDMGVISEATVDSTDVGINAYLSADPEFKNIRGITKDNKDIKTANLMSTAAMLAPFSDRDDQIRSYLLVIISLNFSNCWNPLKLSHHC